MIEEIIKKHLIPPEDFIFGFADLHGLLDSKFKGYNYGISIGKRLDYKIVDKIKDGPTLEYYNHYHLINKQLSDITLSINSDLENIGIDAIILEPTIAEESKANNDQYLKTLSVDISHKMVATRAGLGWIGKTDLLISRVFGPRLRLVSLLLKQKPPLELDPVDISECGKCNICVLNCPAKAATGRSWNITIHRNLFFDAQKCRKKCRELASEIFKIDISICGICVSVCPAYKSKVQ